MEELLTALKEIFEAAAMPGNDLDGVIINDQENVLPEAAENHDIVMLTIAEDEEQYIKSTGWDYELTDGYVYLALITPVNKKEENKWRAAKQLLKPFVKKVRKVLLDNPVLICDSYPQGIIRNPHSTKFHNTKYGYSASGSQWHVFARLRLQTQYLYRQGDISLT